MPPCTRARSRRVTNFKEDDAPARRPFGNEVDAVVAMATDRTVAACADRPTKHTRLPRRVLDFNDNDDAPATEAFGGEVAAAAAVADRSSNGTAGCFERNMHAHQRAA